MTERVTLDGITKQFGDTIAVDEVSLNVEPGETLGLVGPSGCGKTTTLRTVAGFETPNQGRVLFGDEDVTNVAPEKRNVGLVFQSYALFDNMTVQENVEFGLKMREMDSTARATRAEELLELLDIGELAGRDPRTLSGGQQQRVGLARALAIQPRVLLLDEPMTGLDAKLKTRLRREIGGLLDELEVTALYVTHDQEEAMEMCDRIAVMNNGRLEQVGTPREVYRSPANEFVADFIGTSNFLSGEVRNGGVDLGFVTVATNGADLNDGEQATAIIRPEAITVGDGSIEATVLNRTYLGDSVRLLAELPNGQNVILTVDEGAPGPGESTNLSIDESRVRVVGDPDA